MAMTHLMVFLKGFGIGFAIAAVVGPIGILCIRRTISDGQLVGLAIGLGAALADATFGIIAGFGLTFLADFLIAHQASLRFLGGLFLIYLGLKIFFEKPSTQAAEITGRNLVHLTISTFLLTLTNPLTILSFMAIFAGLGIGTANYLAALLLVLGVFLGSMVWWIILTSILRFFHAKVNQTTLTFINKCSGGIIAGFGVLSIFSLLVK
jgi:threonine/homoserine/homoserine lactone efflux protein